MPEWISGVSTKLIFQEIRFLQEREPTLVRLNSEKDSSKIETDELLICTESKLNRFLNN